MAYCSSCNSKFTFMNLLKSTTPWTIRCARCKQKIKTNTIATIIAAIVVLFLCLGCFSVTIGMGFSFKLALIAMLTLTLGLELVWYLLIVKGLVSS